MPQWLASLIANKILDWGGRWIIDVVTKGIAKLKRAIGQSQAETQLKKDQEQNAPIDVQRKHETDYINS